MDKRLENHGDHIGGDASALLYSRDCATMFRVKAPDGLAVVDTLQIFHTLKAAIRCS